MTTLSDYSDPEIRSTPGAYGDGPPRKKDNKTCKKNHGKDHEMEPVVLYCLNQSEMMEDRCIHCGKSGRMFRVYTVPVSRLTGLDKFWHGRTW